MLQKIRPALIAAGPGLWAASLYFFLWRLEWDPSAALAAVLTAVLVLSVRETEAAAPAAFAAAVLLAALWLLPALGLKKTAAAGVLSLLGFLLPRSAGARALPPIPAPVLGLAGAAAVALARCVCLLTGHHFYGAALALSALALGAGLGARAASLTPQGAGGAILAASGLAGILLPGFFRFLGINAGGGEYVQAPLLTPGDVLFLGGQAYAAACLWGFGLTLSSPGRASATSWRLAAAAAGPAAGFALLRFDPAAVFVCLNLALLLLGLAQASGAWRAAVLAAALWAGLGNRDIFRDVWLYRLNLAFPGGGFTAQHQDGGEAIGVYRIQTPPQNLLVIDGAAQPGRSLSAKRAAHLLLTPRSGASRALFLGVRHPQSIDSALAHGIAVDAVDPSPFYPELLKALGRPEVASGGLTVTVSPLRRYLAAPGPRYGAVLLELDAPLHRPANAFRVTREALLAVKARLAPGGILAVRLPQPLLVEGPERLIAALTEAFPRVQACPLEAGLLLLASEEPFDFKDPGARKALPADVWIDDYKLEDFLASEPCRPLDHIAQASPTDDRPPAAFPLGDLLKTQR